MKSNSSHSAPLNLCAPVGVTGTTLPDSCTMVLTEHTLTEWARLAADAYKAGHTMIGDKFSTARTCPAGSRLPIREFDDLQRVYCGWLALGWDRALEVWAERFPTSPIYSQPEPLPASPVKDMPDFSGLAPIFDKAELASRKTAAAPALPVASVGVPDEYQEAFLCAVMDGPEVLSVTLNYSHDDVERLCRDAHSTSDGNLSVSAWPVSEAIKAASSHAAKDARIADLEQALKTVLDLARDTPTDALVRFAYIRSRCRAALALPCA